MNCDIIEQDSFRDNYNISKLPPKVLTPIINSTNESTFVGRVKELNIIDKFFDISNALVLVSSISGVGKSTLASYYLSQQRHLFNYYGYVKINDSFKQDFTSAFKESLNLQQNSLDNLFIEAVTKLNNLKGKKFIIIDNSKDIELNQDKLNLILELINNDFKILFISKRKINDIISHEIGLLSQEEARVLFFKYHKTNDIKRVNELLEYLNNHTFFIKLIAKMINTTDYNLSFMLEKFKSKELLKINFSNTESDNGIDREIINKNLEELLKMQDLTFEHILLLKKLATLPSVEMSYQFIEKIINEKVRNRLDMLSNCGLLTKNGDNYKLHHIIKEYILQTNPITASDIRPIIDYLNKSILDSHNLSVVSKAKENLFYFKSIKNIINIFNIKNREVSTFYENLGNIYYHLGAYDKSEELLKRSMLIREDILGKNHLDISSVYNSLGLVYKLINRYEESLELFKKTLDIRIKVLGDDHIETAWSYNNIGLVYKLMGNYSKALEFFEKSLKLKEYLVGKNDILVAYSHNNIALLYENAKEYRKAYYTFIKVIKIREKILGKKDIETLQSYNSLANLYCLMKKNSKALPILKKCSNIYIENFGDSHSYTIDNYDKLALIYMDLKNHSEALFYFQKSLDLRITTIGEHHPDTAKSYNSLGMFYKTVGKYITAQPLFKKALNIFNHTLGEKSLESATSSNNLATIYYLLDNHNDALNLFQKALNTRKSILTDNHPDTIESYNNLARVYAEFSKENKSLSLYKKSLILSKNILGKEHLNTALTYNNIAVFYFNKKLYGRAYILMLEAIKIRSKLLSRRDIDLINSRSKLKIIKDILHNLKRGQEIDTFLKFRLDFFPNSIKFCNI